MFGVEIGQHANCVRGEYVVVGGWVRARLGVLTAFRFVQHGFIQVGYEVLHLVSFLHIHL